MCTGGCKSCYLKNIQIWVKNDNIIKLMLLIKALSGKIMDDLCLKIFLDVFL